MRGVATDNFAHTLFCFHACEQNLHRPTAMSVDRFYQYVLYAGLAFTPFAFFFNTEIFHALNCSPANIRLNWFFLLMTSLADGLWVIMIATVAQSLRPRNFAVLVLALVIGNILLHSGKFLINADRPLLALGANNVCILGLPLTARSFPSGHAFSAILLFLFVRPRHSVWAGALVLTLAICGAVSRAYVGVHFPRDIVTGGLMAVAAWFLAEILAPRLHLWNMAQGARTAALVIVGAGTALVYIFLYHEKTRELEYLLTPAAYGVVAYWLVFAANRFLRRAAG